MVSQSNFGPIKIEATIVDAIGGTPQAPGGGGPTSGGGAQNPMMSETMRLQLDYFRQQSRYKAEFADYMRYVGGGGLSNNLGNIMKSGLGMTLGITSLIGLMAAMVQSSKILNETTKGIFQILGGIVDLLLLPFLVPIVGFLKLLAGIFGNLAAFMKDPLGYMKDLISNLWKELQNVWKGLLDFGKEFWETIKSIATNFWNTITSIASGVWDIIKTLGSGIWKVIVDIFTGRWDLVIGDIRATWDAIWVKASGIWDDIKDFALEVFEAIKKLFAPPIAQVAAKADVLYGAGPTQVPNWLLSALSPLGLLSTFGRKEIAGDVTVNQTIYISGESRSLSEEDRLRQAAEAGANNAIANIPGRSR